MQKAKVFRSAVIDIGTLKVKFEICEFDKGGNAKTVYKDKFLTVIGRDLDKTGNIIIEKSIVKTINALLECKEICEEYSVDAYDVVGTDALRKAKNGDEVLDRIEKETGYRPRILSHDEEGKIFFKALTKVFGDESFCAVDVGGGSVQVIIGNKNQIEYNKSFKTGAYFMQENFSKTHHPTKEELESAKDYIKEQLHPLGGINVKVDKVIYGSTNIVDFFTAMGIEMNKSGYVDHPFITEVSELYPIYEKIVAKSYEDRMEMYPDEPYYMWAADKALMNIFTVSDRLNCKTIVPTNYNISSGLHYLLYLDNE